MRIRYRLFCVMTPIFHARGKLDWPLSDAEDPVQPHNNIDITVFGPRWGLEKMKSGLSPDRGSLSGGGMDLGGF